MISTLVIQVGRLGDVIQTTPLLNDLIRDPAGCEVELLVCDEFRGAIQGLVGLGRVRSLPIASFDLLERPITDGFKSGNIPRAARDLVRELDLPRFDRVIHCSTTALGCWIAGKVACAKREGGVVTRDNECLFLGDHHVYVLARQFFRDENWFNLVDLWRAAAGHRRALDAASRPHVGASADLPFALPQGRRVAINPGSSASHRRWPAERFARLVEKLSTCGLVPLLVGAPADRRLCEQVAAASRVKVDSFCGRTSIPQMARLLAESDLLVSADTGAVHIAAAMGTKVLGLYGATAYFAQTAPWGAGHLILQTRADGLGGLPPEIAAAAALNRLGLAHDRELQDALAGSSIEAWETAFLPAAADPLGGLTYRPLHAAPWGKDRLFTRALRHAFARSFCGGQAGTDLFGDKPPDCGAAPREGGTRAAIAPVTAVLDRMAAVARRCRELCELPGSASVELPKLTRALAQALEELKSAIAASATKPVVHFLDWKLRMIPRAWSPETFRLYEVEYRRATSLLEEAAGLVDASVGAGLVPASGEGAARGAVARHRAGL